MNKILFISRSVYQIRYLWILIFAIHSHAEGISTKIITPFTATRIVLSQSQVTTLMFPKPFTGVYGLGLVMQDKDAKSNSSGTVRGTYAATKSDKPCLVLNAMTVANTMMTVVMDGQLYVFNLIVGDPPDVAVTLKCGVANESREVSSQDVVDSRPKYDDALLVGIAEKAKNAFLVRRADPESYKEYNHRACSYISDDGSVRTEIKDIHQFSDKDALVLTGTIENNGSGSLNFDQFHVGIAIGRSIHPVTFLECHRPIAAKSSVPFLAEVIGDYDGSRAGFSINNEFRMIVNTGYHVAPAPLVLSTPTPTPVATPSPSPKPSKKLKP